MAATKLISVQFVLRVPEGDYCTGGPGSNGYTPSCEFFDNYGGHAVCKMGFCDPKFVGDKIGVFGYEKANECKALEVMPDE